MDVWQSPLRPGGDENGGILIDFVSVLCQRIELVCGCGALTSKENKSRKARVGCFGLAARCAQNVPQLARTYS